MNLPSLLSLPNLRRAHPVWPGIHRPIRLPIHVVEDVEQLSQHVVIQGDVHTSSLLALQRQAHALRREAHIDRVR